MINGTKVNHKKFGAGTITDSYITNPLTPQSKITVTFDDESVGTKKFALTTVNSMFTEVCDELAKLCEAAVAEVAAIENARVEAMKQRLASLKPCKINEYNESVTKEDWLEAYNVAGNFRWPHESRAVVLDNDMIFINAASAMKHIGSRPKDGDKLYQACEENKPMLDCNWRYATKEDIQLNCLDK